MRFMQRLLAEALGTAFLLTAIIGSGIMAERLTDDVALQLFANAAATGAVLVVLITVLGPVSGAHFNPAVTIAMFIDRRIEHFDGMMYIAVQFAGAVGGMLIAHAMFDLPLWMPSTKPEGPDSVFLSEAVATFGLVFFILVGLRRAPQSVPWIVGLYIFAAYWFTSSTSYANPAVTMARAFTDTFSRVAMEDMPLLIPVQMMAGVATGYLARIFYPPALIPKSSDPFVKS